MDYSNRTYGQLAELDEGFSIGQVSLEGCQKLELVENAGYREAVPLQFRPHCFPTTFFFRNTGRKHQ